MTEIHIWIEGTQKRRSKTLRGPYIQLSVHTLVSKIIEKRAQMPERQKQGHPSLTVKPTKPTARSAQHEH